MTKIKISYETQQELDRLIQILEPYILSLKTVKQQDGRYLKAYIKLRMKGEMQQMKILKQFVTDYQ